VISSLRNIWKTVRLGEVCDVIPGYAFKSGAFSERGIAVVKIKNITTDRQVDIDNVDRFPEVLMNESLRKFLLSDGDILIAMTGATAGKVGKLRTKNAALLNQRVAKIRPVSVHPGFIWNVVSSEEYQDRFFKLADGAAQPNMSGSQIEGVEIPLPPNETQGKIAAIFSAYDDLIENNTGRINILERMVQTIFREWFVQFRAPAVELRKATPEERKLTGQSVFPKGWTLKSAVDAVYVNPRTLVPRQGLKPFVQMSSLVNNSMLIEDIQLKEGNNGSKFKNDDTLFARITPCLENGKTGFVQFLDSHEGVALGSTEFIVLRSKSLTPEFVYLMARSNEFRDNAIKSMSGATGRQRVQEECFRKFFVAHPDTTSLIRFIDIVRPMFRLTHSLSIRNKNLRRTRDLLLPKIISGEVDIESLDIAC
jgi:type I restriction enzyme S subunit